MSRALWRFTKPEGFDERRGPGRQTSADASSKEPHSLAAARARAAQQNIPLDQLFAVERTRLRESNYPGPDCFEPYEIEDHAAGRLLTTERVKHAETCQGCRMLLSGATGRREHLDEFLAAVADVEIDEASERARESTLEFVGAAAAFISVAGVGYLVFRFSPATADPSTRAALSTQLTQLAPKGLLTGMWAISLATLLALAVRYPGELLARARGSLVAGVVVGLIAVFGSWQNVRSVAETMRTTVAFAQRQLTEALAAAGGPVRLSASTEASLGLMSMSSFVTTTTTTGNNGQSLVSSSVRGLPGSVVAELQPSGGDLFWEVGNQKQHLGYILYGTVATTRGNDFVLVDPAQREHAITSPAGAPQVATGSEVMVLMTPADKPVAVYSLARTPRSAQ